jgi:hypothetical protein
LPRTVPEPVGSAGLDNLSAVPQTKANRRPAPNTKKNLPPSKLWVPTLMFSLLLLGITVIVTNYFGLLPGGANNKFLLIGIVEVTGGFVVATMLR